MKTADGEFGNQPSATPSTVYGMSDTPKHGAVGCRLAFK